MAKITINVPAGDATDYLEEVIGQINNGFTSGHVDANTNWDIEIDTNESTDDLR
jgi:hypothetical protein